MERFELQKALFDTAMANIAVRARHRRREAIHDAILIAGAAISGVIATTAGVWLWMLVNGSL